MSNFRKKLLLAGLTATFILGFVIPNAVLAGHSQTTQGVSKPSSGSNSSQGSLNGGGPPPKNDFYNPINRDSDKVDWNDPGPHRGGAPPAQNPGGPNIRGGSGAKPQNPPLRDNRGFEIEKKD